MPGHKENLNKLQRIDFIQSIFSDQSGIKLEINNREDCKDLKLKY